MSYIKTFAPDTKEYKRLEALARVLNNYTVPTYSCNEPITVGVTYFDYGQDWKWTTLLRGYQVLTPKEQELLLTASTTLDGIKAVIDWHNESAKTSSWGTVWEEIV